MGYRPSLQCAAFFAELVMGQDCHVQSLLCAFVVRCLDSIIPPVSKSEISSLYLVSVAAQAGVCLPWSQT